MPSPPGDPTAAGAEVADVGLLTPAYAGTVAEALTGDRAVVDAMVRAEAALLHALADTGVAPRSVTDVADALADVAVDPRDLALAAVSGGNPVIPLVERLRADVPPDVARWVHFGATSQDIVDTALMLVASDVADVLADHLGRLSDSLAALADRHRATPAVARTLTQQAMPTTLGMRLAGWLAGVLDAVRAVRGLTLPASLGGPVGTAAGYRGDGPAVLHAYADRLGLASPVTTWHTRRTPVVELSGALALVGGCCGKVATDVLVMAQTEVAEAREAAGGASSAMPHKSNPAQSVLVAAAARQLPALASVVAASAAAEQERPAGAWHAEWQPLRTMLRLAAGAAERTGQVVAGLRFDTEAMRRNLDRLVTALGRDQAWVDAQIGHVDVWIDRVLERHEEAQ